MGQDGWRVAGYEVTSRLLCYDQLHHTWASHGSCLLLLLLHGSCLSAFYYFYYTWIMAAWLLFVPFIYQLGLSFASEKWSNLIYRFIIWTSRWYCVKSSARETHPRNTTLVMCKHSVIAEWKIRPTFAAAQGRFGAILESIGFSLPQVDQYGIPCPVQNCCQNS